MFFYGATMKYDQIKSAKQAGAGRPGEEHRPDFTDVVFLTTRWEIARSYGAWVYSIDAPTATLYAEAYQARADAGQLHRRKSRKNRDKKIKTLRRDSGHIFVVAPEELNVESCTYYPGTAKP